MLAPPKRRRTWPWIVAAVFVALLCGFGGLALISTQADDGKKLPTIEATNTTQASLPQSKPVDTGRNDAASGKLTASDLKLTVKTTKKDCFGSAGCNVEYQIKASIANGVQPGECDVTYQVNGLEDPQIGTLNVHSDGQYEQDGFQYGQTSSSSKKLTAKITEVDCN